MFVYASFSLRIIWREVLPSETINVLEERTAKCWSAGHGIKCVEICRSTYHRRNEAEQIWNEVVEGDSVETKDQESLPRTYLSVLHVFRCVRVFDH